MLLRHALVLVGFVALAGCGGSSSAPFAPSPFVPSPSPAPAPRLVLQRRVLQFTQTTDDEFTATDVLISDAHASELLTHLRWALPQVTGGRFTAFASEQQETAGGGERVVVTRPGDIVVADYQGLTATTTRAGWGRWAWDARGVIVGGIIMLDRGFDTSVSPNLRSLRGHELGHALGYNHVTSRTSFMNSPANVEPNAFDRDASTVAFQREPGSRSPDVDPTGFTANSTGSLAWEP